MASQLLIGRKSYLNDREPVSDLSIRSTGSEPVKLFPLNFLQNSCQKYELIPGFDTKTHPISIYKSHELTYKVFKNCSSDRNLGTDPVKLLFDKSLKIKKKINLFSQPIDLIFNRLKIH